MSTPGTGLGTTPHRPCRRFPKTGNRPPGTASGNRSEPAATAEHPGRSEGDSRFPEPVGTDAECRWEPEPAYKAVRFPAPPSGSGSDPTKDPPPTAPSTPSEEWAAAVLAFPTAAERALRQAARHAGTPARALLSLPTIGAVRRRRTTQDGPNAAA